MTRARTVPFVGWLVLLLLMGAGIVSAPRATAAVQATRRPTLWYQTATAVYLRSPGGAVRKLTSTSGLGLVAWSADGTRAAWLTSTGHLVLTVLAGGTVRSWKCSECQSPVFEGDTLITGSYRGRPHLLRFPANGSAPTVIPVTGLPTSKIESGLFDLLTATPAGQLIGGFGLGVSAAGGPQLLYRISATGKARLLAPAKRQITSNGIPFGFVYSANGSRMAFVLPAEGGICADTTRPVLTTLASGAQSAPAAPKGLWSVAGLWYSPSGTPYAALAHGPSHCRPDGKSVIQQPIVYRQSGSRWVRAGTGTIDAAYFPGGWGAVLSGKVYWTTLGGVGPQGPARLTVTHGSSKTTIAGVVRFGWLP